MRDFGGFPEPLERHARLDPLGHRGDRILGQTELAVDRRGDRARADRVDAHAARGEFDGERASQREDGALRGRVGGRRWHAHRGDDGCVEDDRGLGRQDGQERLGQEERSLHIDRELPVVIGFGHRLQRREQSDPGVEKGDVELAELGADFGRQRLGGGNRARVRADRKDARAQVLRSLGEIVGVVAGDGDARAFGHEAAGGFEAHAGRAAGDERGFALQTGHMRSLPFGVD